jgi:hypothetical protein
MDSDTTATPALATETFPGPTTSSSTRCAGMKAGRYKTQPGSIDGISEVAWLPPVSGDRPHVQVKLAKATRPAAITDVLRRCLQQIVDTGQVAQAIVAVAL